MPVYSPPLYGDASQAVFWEEFVGSAYNSRVWTVTGTGSIASLAQLGGRIRVRGNAANTYRLNHGTFNSFSVAANAICTWRGAMTIPNGGTGGVVEVGLHDGSNPTTHRIIWQAARGTANFQCICTNAGTSTTTSSGVAVDTNDHEFMIETVTGSVKFYLDGVLRVTTTTNITANLLMPRVLCTGSSTVVADFSADWVRVVGNRS